jgi:glucose/arabinose dehydrogenase
MNFSSDSHLAVASNDGMVKLWDIKPTTQSEGSTDPVLLTQLNGHQGAVSTIRFSPDGKLIATGGADGTVRLWTIKGQQLNEVRHQDPVSTVRFSPDGKLIATGWTDGTIRILNIQGQKLAQSEGHQGAISSFGFSSNGQILASGGIDGTVRVWNLSGQELTHFYTHQGKIPQVNFMLDGRIITSGSDGTVRVWKLGERGNLEQLLSRGCSWLKDYFATHPEVLDKVSTCRDRAS